MVKRQEPLYNIRVVAQITGLPEATLRAWERRYRFPEPARSPGGHRLYSDQDLVRLQWVKARIAEGLQTGQAIRALRHVEQEGHFDSSSFSPVMVEPQAAEPALEALFERLMAALERHDLPAADQVLNDGLAFHLPEDLILKVIRPALTELGQAWAEERITIATEHLGSNYLRHRLLMWLLTGPPPRTVRPILLACAPDEWHEGSLLILGALLRRRRWPVLYLGQAVPLPDLAKLVEDIKPSAVVWVAMREPTAQALAEWPRWFPDALFRNLLVGFGGRIFSEQPAWRERVPGVFLGATLEEGLVSLERLLSDVTQLEF